MYLVLVFVIILALHSTLAQTYQPGIPPSANHVGSLYDAEHGVSGRVYVHYTFIYIGDFFFRGNCPEPVFVASNISREPDKKQFVYLPYSGDYSASGTKYLKNVQINNTVIGLDISSTFRYIDSIKWFAFWCDRSEFFMGTVQFQHHIGRLVGGGFSGDVFTSVRNDIVIENYRHPTAEEKLTFVAVSASGIKTQGWRGWHGVVVAWWWHAQSGTVDIRVVHMPAGFNATDVTLVHVENAAGKILALTEIEVEDQDTRSWWDFFCQPFYFFSSFS